MRIDIVTVFPEMVAPALDHSIVKRARERGLITINVVNLRDFTTDRHRTTDDIPYGGGGGMVMKIEPIAHALASLINVDGHTNPLTSQEPSPPRSGGRMVSGQVLTESETDFSGVSSGGWDALHSSVSLPSIGPPSNGSIERPRIVLTDPRGPRFTQETAKRWARERHLIILCGHYEGVDERVRQHLVTDEVSIGDYILTGGEFPALIIADALTRLQPGALGDEQAPDKDTFADDLLEYPHYTRPRDFNGWDVPEILLCGHHAQIQLWRRWHQLRATRERRPDLFARLNLTARDLALLGGVEPAVPSEPKGTRRSRTEPVPTTPMSATAHSTVQTTVEQAADTTSSPDFVASTNDEINTAETNTMSHSAVQQCVNDDENH